MFWKFSAACGSMYRLQGYRLRALKQDAGKMFKKILIANRGEIALRVIRACRELDIASVAVYSEADEKSLHLQPADERICIGPAISAKSYLNIDSIIKAAKRSGADAIHPGYGYLAVKEEFFDPNMLAPPLT